MRGSRIISLFYCGLGLFLVFLLTYNLGLGREDGIRSKELILAVLPGIWYIKIGLIVDLNRSKFITSFLLLISPLFLVVPLSFIWANQDMGTIAALIYGLPLLLLSLGSIYVLNKTKVEESEFNSVYFVGVIIFLIVILFFPVNKYIHDEGKRREIKLLQTNIKFGHWEEQLVQDNAPLDCLNPKLQKKIKITNSFEVPNGNYDLVASFYSYRNNDKTNVYLDLDGQSKKPQTNQAWEEASFETHGGTHSFQAEISPCGFTLVGEKIGNYVIRLHLYRKDQKHDWNTDLFDLEKTGHGLEIESKKYGVNEFR